MQSTSITVIWRYTDPSEFKSEWVSHWSNIILLIWMMLQVLAKDCFGQNMASLNYFLIWINLCLMSVLSVMPIIMHSLSIVLLLPCHRSVILHGGGLQCHSESSYFIVLHGVFFQSVCQCPQWNYPWCYVFSMSGRSWIVTTVEPLVALNCSIFSSTLLSSTLGSLNPFSEGG